MADGEEMLVETGQLAATTSVAIALAQKEPAEVRKSLIQKSQFDHPVSPSSRVSILSTFLSLSLAKMFLRVQKYCVAEISPELSSIVNSCYSLSSGVAIWPARLCLSRHPLPSEHCAAVINLCLLNLHDNRTMPAMAPRWFQGASILGPVPSRSAGFFASKTTDPCFH